MKLAEPAQKLGDNFESSVKTALAAVLCSKSFLYLEERGTGVPPVGPAAVSPAAAAGKMPAGPTAGTAVPRLTDYELASRLSYFLSAAKRCNSSRSNPRIIAAVC